MVSVERIISMLLLVLLVSCSSVMAAGQSPVAGLPNRHNGYDLKVAWQEAKSDNGMVVYGAIRNVRYAPVADLDVAVFLIDKQNHIVASGRGFPLPVPIVDRDFVTFSVTMSDTKGTNPDATTLGFFIRYRTVDEGWWGSTFRYDLAAHKEITESSLYKDEW